MIISVSPVSFIVSIDFRFWFCSAGLPASCGGSSSFNNRRMSRRSCFNIRRGGLGGDGGGELGVGGVNGLVFCGGGGGVGGAGGVGGVGGGVGVGGGGGLIRFSRPRREYSKKSKDKRNSAENEFYHDFIENIIISGMSFFLRTDYCYFDDSERYNMIFIINCSYIRFQ